MKRIEFIVATVAILFLASSAPAEAPRVGTFVITMELTNEGLSMRCSDGCAWETLTVGGCKPGGPCRFVLDQSGVHGLPEHKK